MAADPAQDAQISRPSGLPGVAVAAGLGLVAGLSLPLARGLAPALAVGACAIALVARRGPPGDPARVGALPRAHRYALAALLLAPAIPAVTVAARALAGVVVAYPASLWALAPALLAAFVPAGKTWSKGPVLVVLVLGTFLAGAWGARFEAAGAHARGETWGGPILGIHPFQATAVLVDGHGPFDLPINDYVEPDGSKGYGPEGLAAAIERDLHAIAALQFAEHGPARAYAAFAGATVVAEQLPGVPERLDREPEQPVEPRLHVTSGGVGRRSRVEFVCPGAANDPRPRQPDAVMERMCPDKYSAEASAGLGLTGRWTGYAEFLGQPRLGLGRALGWSRERVGDELRAWAWIAIGLVGAAALGARGRAAAGLARWGGGVALAAAVLAVLFLVPGLSIQVEARAAGEGSPWAVAPWIALLALGSGHAAIAGRDPGEGAAGRGSWLKLAPLAAGTLGMAASLAAALWIVPQLGPPTGTSGPVPLEGLIAGLGEALHRGAGIGVFTAEGIIAAAVVAVLVGLLAALLGPVAGVAGVALAPGRPRLGARAALLVVLVPAALLVLSRKTVGGAVLLAPAAATAWMAGTGLALAIPARVRGRWPAVLEHLLAAAIVALAGVQVVAAHDNHMTRIALGVCAVVVVAGLVLLRPPRA